MKRVIISLVATILGLVIGYTGYTLRANQLRLRLELQHKQQQIELKDKTIQDSTKQIQDLQRVKDDLEVQLQSKRKKQAYEAQLASYTKIQLAPVANCGDNQYAQFIYMHESGCRTTALNSIGCYGIGQSCPASKIAHCGSDYACQNAWFSNYAKKYCYLGTANNCWYGSYLFWLANRWW